jgi:hypothetical protein
MQAKVTLTGKIQEEYSYQAFGLNFRTCLPCPELLPSNQPPEVTITYGQVPEALEAPLAAGEWYQSTPGLILLKIRNVAKYLVKDGKEIIIDRAPQASDADVRLFLLGSAMGALMHQRGLLPLHGSAIRLPDGTAAIFMGPSGIGKSTLAAAFRQRGYVVAADDVSLIFSGADGTPILQPAYPELKLWAEAAAKIGEDAEVLPRARTLLEKFSLCFHDVFDGSPLPVRLLYILETAEDELFEITRLQGVEKLEGLLRNTYRLIFIDDIDQRRLHFQLCASLGSKIVMSRVQRPRQNFRLKELVELLERDFGKGKFYD